jgi:hypothetical protein
MEHVCIDFDLTIALGGKRLSIPPPEDFSSVLPSSSWTYRVHSDRIHSPVVAFLGPPAEADDLRRNLADMRVGLAPRLQ